MMQKIWPVDVVLEEGLRPLHYYTYAGTVAEASAKVLAYLGNPSYYQVDVKPYFMGEWVA